MYELKQTLYRKSTNRIDALVLLLVFFNFFYPHFILPVVKRLRSALKKLCSTNTSVNDEAATSNSGKQL